MLLAIPVQRFCRLHLCMSKEFCVGFKAAQMANLLSESAREHVTYTRRSVTPHPAGWRALARGFEKEHRGLVPTSQNTGKSYISP